MAPVEEHTVRTVALPLPGGTELRASLWLDEDGEPHELALSRAWSDDPVREDSDGAVRVPAVVLPDLLEALEELAPEASP